MKMSCMEKKYTCNMNSVHTKNKYSTPKHNFRHLKICMHILKKMYQSRKNHAYKNVYV